MSATLGAKLPKDDRSGFHVIADSLLTNPQHLHAVIMLVDCGKIVEDIDEDTKIPMARIRRIEVVAPSDYKLADQIMRRAMGDRHGSTELPLDEQRDLFTFLHPDVTMPEEMRDPNAVTTRNTNDDDQADEDDPWPGDATEDDNVTEEQPAEEKFDDADQAARKKEDKRIAAVHAKRRRAEANPVG